jgi:hypothetical protein
MADPLDELGVFCPCSPRQKSQTSLWPNMNYPDEQTNAEAAAPPYFMQNSSKGIFFDYTGFDR